MRHLPLNELIPFPFKIIVDYKGSKILACDNYVCFLRLQHRDKSIEHTELVTIIVEASGLLFEKRKFIAMFRNHLHLKSHCLFY